VNVAGHFGTDDDCGTHSVDGESAWLSSDIQIWSGDDIQIWATPVATIGQVRALAGLSR